MNVLKVERKDFNEYNSITGVKDAKPSLNSVSIDFWANLVGYFLLYYSNSMVVRGMFVYNIYIEFKPRGKIDSMKQIFCIMVKKFILILYSIFTKIFKIK